MKPSADVKFITLEAPDQPKPPSAKSRHILTKLLAILILGVGAVAGLFSCVPNFGFNRSLPKWVLLNLNRSDSNHVRENGLSVTLAKRLPQCIIIGVKKGGTRALLKFLKLHPDIRVANPEIHFFDYEYNYFKGLEWYRARMPESLPGQITMEKTPAYFVVRPVPARVHHMNSSIKLILILREPTERAISDYTQIHEKNIKRGNAYPSFESLAIDGAGRVITSYKAIQRSVYHVHLAHWYEYFPKNQILVINSENLVNDPANVTHRVEDFLNLRHSVNKEIFYFNPTKRFYCLRTGKNSGCLSQSKGRTHPKISPEVLKKLHEYFRPHNQRLYKMTGQDFGWP